MYGSEAFQGGLQTQGETFLDKLLENASLCEIKLIVHCDILSSKFVIILFTGTKVYWRAII